MAKMINPLWPLKIMNQLQAGDDFFGSMRCSSLYEGKPELRKVGSIEIQSRAAAHSNQQRRKQPPQLETFTFFETRIIKNASNNKADAERHNTLPI